MRDHDREPAERLVAAMKALSDIELISVVQPLVDIQGMVSAGHLDRPRPPLVELMGNPQAVELMEAFGQWVFAELHHREQVLEALSATDD